MSRRALDVMVGGSSRAHLGVSRVRGWVEMAIWLIIAALVAQVGWKGGLEGRVLAVVLLAALAPYALKALRTIREGSQLAADARTGVFLRGGRRALSFDEVRALRSRMVNATCEEFELTAECRDGRRVVLYEGPATNAAYRTVERMASLARVPFHHDL